MGIFIPIGAVFTIFGLFGLGYCIWRANKLRTIDLDDQSMTAELQKLIPVNLASVFVSAIGLAMVVVGLLL